MKKVFLLGFALAAAMGVSAQSLKDLHAVKVDGSSVVNTQPREEKYLSHSGDEYGTSIGTGEAATFEVAHIFDSSDLKDFVGWHMQKVEFFPTESACVYSIGVWDGETESVALRFNELNTADLTMNAWNMSGFDAEDLTVQAGKDYYVGYRVATETGHPVGCDQGPADDGIGDLIRFLEEDGTFTAFESIHAAVPTINYNFLIRVYLHDGVGNEVVLGNQATAFVQDGMINVNNANGEVVLYNMNGQIVYRGAATSFAAPAVRGTYVLTVGGQSIKLAI